MTIVEYPEDDISKKGGVVKMFTSDILIQYLQGDMTHYLFLLSSPVTIQDISDLVATIKSPPFPSLPDGATRRLVQLLVSLKHPSSLSLALQAIYWGGPTDINQVVSDKMVTSLVDLARATSSYSAFSRVTEMMVSPIMNDLGFLTICRVAMALSPNADICHAYANAAEYSMVNGRTSLCWTVLSLQQVEILTQYTQKLVPRIVELPLQYTGDEISVVEGILRGLPVVFLSQIIYLLGQGQTHPSWITPIAKQRIRNAMIWAVNRDQSLVGASSAQRNTVTMFIAEGAQTDNSEPYRKALARLANPQ